MLLITVFDLPDEHVSRIKEITNMPVHVDPNLENDNVPLDEVEILITYGLENINSDLLDRMPALKWIQVFQTGVEHIPLDEISKRGILLTNVRGIYNSPMSEYVMSLVLYVTRDIERFIRNQKQRKYDRTELVEEVNGKTIGIFGTGTIGQEVAKKAKAFDMKVLGFNSNGRSIPSFDEVYTWDSKNQMLEQCDFVVLLLPETEQTRNFIGEEELKLMKNDAYLINIGRGPLVNDEALIHSVESGEIRGAALDVFDVEPLPEDSPLWDVENILITPHLSGKSVRFFERSINIFEENFKAHREGRDLTFVVDAARGY
ncbi:D-2-hydroxyacid dehydrogenase [Siminovitchia acidinfaciens]|uniref:D-2-hydroxyacid dehydrogenase n=1 Tax=Siminovitchia acidinfaciens TaxID=2321395 RepID=A0A429Y7H7_9BACI|nr:D-2-hydroxyacid dehydrogenase [Siminovitchia acidinfaciens]RST77427.1 D-2-hydroxyacid dehydrogenase [Siminovitchia acidinfaciens]